LVLRNNDGKLSGCDQAHLPPFILASSLLEKALSAMRHWPFDEFPPAKEDSHIFYPPPGVDISPGLSSIAFFNPISFPLEHFYPKMRLFIPSKYGFHPISFQ
jgi:hypothetical protein